MSDGTGNYPRRERFLQNIGRDNQEVGNSVTTLAGSRPTDNFVVEKFGNKALDETLEENDVEDGDFIDAYNRNVKKDVAGTITTRVSDSNGTFIAERLEKEKLCDDLIEKGEANEGDVVNHSRPKSPKVGEDGVTPTITTRADELGVVVLGKYTPSGHNAARVVDTEGLSPTVMENHGTVTAIPIKNNTKKGYLLAEEGDAVDISGRMEYHRGTVQKGISQTVTTAGGDNIGVVIRDETLYSDLEKELFTEDGNIRRYVDSDVVDEFKEGQMATTTFPNGYGHGPRTHNESVALNTVDRPSVKMDLRIRKLVPLECLKLMGFERKDEQAMREIGMTDSAIYHCAGDSIVTTCLMAIFGQMLFDEETLKQKIENYVGGLTNEKDT